MPSIPGILMSSSTTSMRSRIGIQELEGVMSVGHAVNLDAAQLDAHDDRLKEVLLVIDHQQLAWPS